MSFDDFDARTFAAQQAAASEQVKSSMSSVVALLGDFRGLCIASGFTTGAAEDLAIEWFTRMLDNAAPVEDD